MSVGKQQGFTLVEAMIAVAILGIIATMAVPAMSGYMDRRRIINAAEQVYSQLQFARSEAITRSQVVFVNFSTDGSTTWSFGISDTSGCDPTIDDPETAGACTLIVDGTKVLRVTDNNDSSTYTDISIGGDGGGAVSFAGSGLGSETQFDFTRGTAKTGTIVVKYGERFEMHVTVNATGRVHICTPTGDTAVKGYTACI